MSDVILEDLSKSYRDVIAVNKINLDIEDGEFVTLVGPSGCGKSTTLEMIAGLTERTSGSITIGDREVSGLPPKHRNIAMVFQNIALFPHLNVYDNVSFGLNIRDYDGAETEKRVERALDIVQLPEMGDRMPEELSGGQRQRVAIARSIVREPDVFLMDEPLANLDAKLRVHMRTELQRLHNQLDTTIIYVTHDQAEAMTMSDRMAVLNEGELQQFAPPLTCYNEPANVFVAGFIGSPSMNLIDGAVDGRAVVTEYFSVDARPVDGLSDGSDIVLGIRPEDVYLSRNTASVGAPSDPVEVVAEVIEPMGDEIFVYLNFEESAEAVMEGQDSVQDVDQLLISVDPDSDIEEGDLIEIVFDRANTHLFDGESGDALSHDLTETSGRES
ncbi:ABC transporter ATP-binding protein [Halorubrum rubrum]|uniref:ABC-type D-xylose/L-arabinose transporter n=1 Tax=Halorubrum rubrum TaxID=1126240 RepID=A0ABD5QZN6_9EURY|nr:ABC transporter ATP-binding protein [Halorubrum rubrum]